MIKSRVHMSDAAKAARRAARKAFSEDPANAELLAELRQKAAETRAMKALLRANGIK